MLFYPERVAFAGLLVYLAFWVLAPVEMNFPLSWGASAYIVLCYLAFFLGTYVLRRTRRFQESDQPRHFSRQAFRLFAALGMLGMALRLYDRYVSRQAWGSSSVLEMRQTLADVGAGPLAAIGGALFPFCYVPLIIWWVNQRVDGGGLSPRTKWIAAAIFVMPALDALTFLSRSQMLVAFSMMYFAAACVLYEGRPMHRQMRAGIVLGGLTLALVSMGVFLSRLGEMEVALQDSILNSAYGYALSPNDWARVGMMGEGIAGAAVSSLLPIFQYYLHGFFEFGLLWDRPGDQIFTYGAQIFAPYIKLLSVAGILDAPAPSLDAYHRVGVFTTFFGPLWIEFGWLGLPFMFVFGIACKYVSRKAMQRRAAFLPLHAYLCVVLLFLPVVNFLVSAQGMYVVNAFVTFGVIASYSRRLGLRRA